MGDIPTPMGSFPAAPASADAPTVLLWVVTVLVVLLAVVCFLLWQRIQREAANCAEQNKAAREEAESARETAKADASAARQKIEDLYRQAIDQLAERESRLITVVSSNTDVLREVKDISSGYYRTLREQRERREAGGHDPARPHGTA